LSLQHSFLLGLTDGVDDLSMTDNISLLVTRRCVPSLLIPVANRAC